ncbi:polysaccharide deacetylase family protein [Clostridium bowmanii]|uniref:polysaccharide deacetylase family protein n=1 Tax=Clostridium bowmanii TaxID=132925 RepID=UPI001C0CAE83|nr:polysaccharide deacetylase family protein [Clostridium bowmanii]MBU3191719.1 polysaccharide deacetylase family protein [Clostridium bowmanii]MCA1076032.1 polysaccharide deacetylase family protein [Clostridium bowmanii]
MNLNKKSFIIIILVLLIGSVGLIYKVARLINHSEINNSEINNINALNEKKTPKVNSEDEKSTPKQTIELGIDDSSKIEKKVVEVVPIFHVHNSKIPILMYHSISYEKGNTARIPKEKFKEQMKYLKDNKYTTLTVDELYSYMQTGKLVPIKPIVITFDDGYKDNYTNAYPILKEFGLKATVFVITNTIDTEKNYLTSNEIRSMDSNNMRIASHTTAHEQLDKISYSDNVKTMTASKAKLEKILGRNINYFAYPYGVNNDSTRKAAKESGYKLAFSTQYGWIDKDDNIYSLGRIFVSSNLNLEQFKAKLNPKK